MPLPWVRLDTTHPWNPKILALVEAGQWRAIVVYDMGLAYCGGHDTDGFIPHRVLSYIHGTPAVARQLVDVGLWTVDPKGWFMPNWPERQQLSTQTSDTRTQLTVAGLKGNCIRWHGRDCGCWRRSPI